MKLKIVRYKNYGNIFRFGELNARYYSENYYSFYELNNGKIIYLINMAVYENNELISFNYTHDYAVIELNNGKTHSYSFGDAKGGDEVRMTEEFFDWFDTLPNPRDLKNRIEITSAEEKCIEEFYLQNIETTKEIKTDTIEVLN